MKKNPVDLEARLDDDCTPLLRAVWNGHAEVARILMEKGADSTAMDKHGQTLLCVASMCGHLDIVKDLLADSPGDLHILETTNGTLPIHSAAEHGHLEVLQYLLEQYENPAAPGGSAGSPRQERTTTESQESKECLINQHSGVNLQSKSGQTLLHFATVRGHFDIVMYLPDNKADQGILDATGRSPLALASYYAQLETIELLLSRPGSNQVLLDAAGRTPLFLAAARGHSQVIQRLLAMPSIETSLLLKKDIYNSTPISVALRNGHEDAVVQLSRSDRPSLESEDFGGNTLGHWVRSLASDRLETLLLDNKWDDRSGVKNEPEKDDTEKDDQDEKDDKGEKDNKDKKPREECDVCLKLLGEFDHRYECGVCDRAVFIECGDCFEFGHKYPDKSHNFTYKADEVEGDEGEGKWVVLQA